MELLNFEKDGLKKISLEGMTTIDNEKVDKDGDILLGVDLTEYVGGEDFERASKINILQLKYSTRRQKPEWTAARLCQGKKNKHDLSSSDWPISLKDLLPLIPGMMYCKSLKSN